MARSAEWWHIQRARGLCGICRRPMRDEDNRLTHQLCQRLVGQHKTWAEIRTMTTVREGDSVLIGEERAHGD